MVVDGVVLRPIRSILREKNISLRIFGPNLGHTICQPYLIIRLGCFVLYEQATMAYGSIMNSWDGVCLYIARRVLVEDQ